MADNVTIDNGALTDFDAATDDVGGKHYQRVKIDLGGDGASTPVVGSVPVSGTIAHDAADSGNPVKVGGVYRETDPVVADGDRVDLLVDQAGRASVHVFSGAVGLTGGVSGEQPDVTGTSDAAALNVGGNVAHDTADSGNPVKIGGKGTFTIPTGVTDGDRVDAWFDPEGRQIVAAAVTVIGADAAPNGDQLNLWDSNGNGSGALTTRPSVFNGTSWDRQRGDTLGIHVSRAAQAATATLANVAGSASSVTLQASNTARKGLTIWNDSSAILYVKLGTTASTTSCTVKMIADAYYEVPYGYTGRVDGIWASATGSARMTEMT